MDNVIIKRGALIKSVPMYERDTRFTGSKAVKESTKDNLTVSNNGVEYDVDTVSLVYMNAVVNIANLKFIQELVKSNPEMQTLYDEIYKSTIVWKGADNLPHNVQIESIPETMEEAMNMIANTIGV